MHCCLQPHCNNVTLGCSRRRFLRRHHAGRAAATAISRHVTSRPPVTVDVHAPHAQGFFSRYRRLRQRCPLLALQTNPERHTMRRKLQAATSVFNASASAFAVFGAAFTGIQVRDSASPARRCCCRRSRAAVGGQGVDVTLMRSAASRTCGGARTWRVTLSPARLRCVTPAADEHRCCWMRHWGFGGKKAGSQGHG